MENVQEKIELRQQANTLLLASIAIMAKYHKELRFNQILWSLGIVDREDRFYEEPIDTLRRCRQIILDSLKDTNPLDVMYLKEEISKLLDK